MSQEDKDLDEIELREKREKKLRDADNEEVGKKAYLNDSKRITIIYCTRTHS